MLHLLNLLGSGHVAMSSLAQQLLSTQVHGKKLKFSAMLFTQQGTHVCQHSRSSLWLSTFSMLGWCQGRVFCEVTCLQHTQWSGGLNILFFAKAVSWVICNFMVMNMRQITLRRVKIPPLIHKWRSLFCPLQLVLWRINTYSTRLKFV